MATASTKGKASAADAAAAALRFGRVKSNLKMGLVGLPNVGKSSLFNLLTAQSVPAENYPFCTIKPNEARCAVPDERFDYLCGLWKPPSLQPAHLLVTDIAGLIRGASEGAGLGNSFLSHILGVDGLFHVVRLFDDSEVLHVDDSLDPVRDLETVTRELCLKDLEFVRAAVAVETAAAGKRSAIANAKPDVILFGPMMAKLTAMLEQGMPVRAGEWSASEVALINDKLHLLTTKPCVYVANMSAGEFERKKSKWLAKVHAWISAHGGGALVPVSVQHEEALAAGGSTSGEAVAASGLPKLIRTGYHELNLIHFFTAGETEVRAWTVYGGATAVEASAVIHTDFAKAFIKAEVVSYEDFKALCNDQKSMAPLRSAGKYRVEGRTYILKDGDMVHFQIGQLTAPKKR